MYNGSVTCNQALGLHCTTVSFLPRIGLKTTTRDSPGRASALRGGHLPSGQLTNSKVLRVPTTECSFERVSSRSCRGGKHTYSAPLGGQALTGETSPCFRARGTQLPSYPFLNSLFPRKSLLTNTAYLYLPGSSFLF